jgi:hypothetical protein
VAVAILIEYKIQYWGETCKLNKEMNMLFLSAMKVPRLEKNEVVMSFPEGIQKCLFSMVKDPER